MKANTSNKIATVGLAQVLPTNSTEACKRQKNGPEQKKGGDDRCKIERQKDGKVREREEEQRRRVFLSRRALKGGYVTAYWGAKPEKAKLTTYSNSQVRRLQDSHYSRKQCRQ